MCVCSGARLPPRRCAALAAATTRTSTWLELQQHVLAAATDILMHLNGHLDVRRLRLVPPPPPLGLVPAPASPSPSTRRAASPVEADVPVELPLELQATPTLELVSELWAAHSSLPGGSFQPTRGLMALLPGFLHNAGVMYSYPASQMVAAAVWRRHFESDGDADGAGPGASATGAWEAEDEDDGGGGWDGAGSDLVGYRSRAALDSPRGRRCGKMLRRVLFEVGDAGGAVVALEALLGPGCVRRVRVAEEIGEPVGRDGGGSPREVGGTGGVGGAFPGGWDGAQFVEGVIPDLAHEAFQGIDPLVF
jgi:hypothetical protein